LESTSSDQTDTYQCDTVTHNQSALKARFTNTRREAISVL
jgi:hypothetical protein